MKPTNYVAFDVDETLVSMDQPHYDALNRALAEVAGPLAPITPREHRTTFKGLPTRRKLELLAAAGRVSPLAVAEVARRKQEYTLAAIRDRLRPEAEKVAVLRALRDAGWHACACSNAVRASVRAMLSATGLLGYMEFYLSNEDAPPKPDPGMYRLAAHLYGIAPADLVVIEDAEPGRRAARAAGCRLIEIAGPGDVTPDAILPRIAAAAQMPVPEPMHAALVG